MSLTAFISGHIVLTENEFEANYIPLIDKALKAKHNFVIGDANGADSMAQKYLKGKTKNVIVFHMFKIPRNNKGGFKTIGGFESDNQRDKAMTLISNYDIAWIRPDKEKSGTARNINRRTNKFLVNYSVNGIESLKPLEIIVNAPTLDAAKIILGNSKIPSYDGKNPNDLIINHIVEVTNKPIYHLLNELKFI